MNLRALLFQVAGCLKPSLVSALRAHCVRPQNRVERILNIMRSMMARRVSYMDVTNKFVPDEFVNSCPGHHNYQCGNCMRKFFSILLMVIGAATAAYCGLVALVFSGVFLMGIDRYGRQGSRG